MNHPLSHKYKDTNGETPIHHLLKKTIGKDDKSTTKILNHLKKNNIRVEMQAPMDLKFKKWD